MSQRKSGKGKGKHFEDVAALKQRSAVTTTQQDENQFPGAMKRNTMVMAKMRNGDVYEIAKIIDIRVAFDGANQSPELHLITTNTE